MIIRPGGNVGILAAAGRMIPAVIPDVSYVNGNSGTISAANNFTVPIPAGAVEGDWIGVAMMNVTASRPVNNLAARGFTDHTQRTAADGGFGAITTHFFWKFITGADIIAGSWNFTMAGNVSGVWASIVYHNAGAYDASSNGVLGNLATSGNISASDRFMVRNGISLAVFFGRTSAASTSGANVGTGWVERHNTSFGSNQFILSFYDQFFTGGPGLTTTAAAMSSALVGANRARHGGQIVLPKAAA